MKALEASRATEIRRLHEEIWGAIRTTLDKAIRVDELLTEQKAGMKHVEWLPWIAENCPFAEQTASDELRKVLFSFAQDMGKTLIAIEAMSGELLTDKAAKVGTT
jgi:hypothetical protein